MTTASWSTVTDCRTDAGFRAWVAEYIAKLVLIGLVQTADTGQIDPATCTRPASATASVGYFMLRFDDPLQATAPIFIKVEPTLGHMTTSCPGSWVTVGTGTNGAGTLTGTVGTRLYVGTTGNSLGSIGYTTAYPSYACAVAGCAWIVQKPLYGMTSSNGYHAGIGSWLIERYSDADGTPNGNGWTFSYISGSATSGDTHYAGNHNWQSVRTQATAAVFVATGANNAVWPGGGTCYLSSTLPNGDLQVIPAWTCTKEIQQRWAVCAVWLSELAQGTTFSATIKGASPRTYIALGGGFGHGGIGLVSGANTTGWAAIWE